MILTNKLGIKNQLELAKEEERISKLKAKALFESGFLDTLKAGSFESLRIIHQKLFEDIYDFAGKIREVNTSKGNFRFAPAVYLHEAIKKIELMEQSCFEQIVEKYVEMNVAHPFREGNGRSMRIWIDLILKKELKKVVDWSLIDKDDYIMAMQRSPIKDVEIKILLQNALSDDIHSFNIFARGIDVSYYYEGYTLYKTKELF
ncbi:TPA: protein adenylyltransferase Fic [Campylobacter lari]|uniref:protein adenylyltransferase Fic n=1 Tax=Campylobacter lari TaxID=201 RepID=UPI0012714B8B|nr:Fic family protein [Campylobacter lari]EAI8647237.1 cell filamentation protein Fic [Campylobacter lari]EAJ1119861.1 cell filamentation protein Fic [Campylobacter lari]EAJ6453103.1 cell filamentation protein Fic [Campylobacter lari]EAK0771329.1 cell filamentation protein Fic [Campylobacter lari]EAK6012114.1 cell filamentation protein Fic [Campylobacter lari]